MTWQLLKGVEGNGDRSQGYHWERLFAILSWESPKRGRPKLWSVRVGAGKNIHSAAVPPAHQKVRQIPCKMKLE